jgi:hypothetical protein
MTLDLGSQALVDAALAVIRSGEWSCGHVDAKFPLMGALYCSRCADRAWQRFIHEGHPDQPAEVPLVRSVHVVKVQIGWSETSDYVEFDCGHAMTLDTDDDNTSLVGSTTQCGQCKRG